MDKPIKSRRVSAQTRVYYIDTFLDKKGNPYISISEIPTSKAPGGKKRQRVFIHSANINKFLEALREELESLEKNDS